MSRSGRCEPPRVVDSVQRSQIGVFRMTEANLLNLNQVNRLVNRCDRSESAKYASTKSCGGLLRSGSDNAGDRLHGSSGECRRHQCLSPDQPGFKYSGSGGAYRPWSVARISSAAVADVGGKPERVAETGQELRDAIVIDDAFQARARRAAAGRRIQNVSSRSIS